MPYTARITRKNPSCLILLIDQSGSMADSWAGKPKRKDEGVATVVNRLLYDLMVACTPKGEPWDYYHIGAIGFGATVGPTFSGTLAGRELVPMSEIANNPARIEEREQKVEDGTGGLVTQRVKFPIWFDPVANGNTPMREALGSVHRILSGWLPQHSKARPPVVILVTDGESTDGDPTEMMKAVTDLTSEDGNVVLFNVHLSSNPKLTPISFPSAPTRFDDPYAQMLFDNASVLTPPQREIAAKVYHIEATETTKGFVLNAQPEDLIIALNIGSEDKQGVER